MRGFNLLSKRVSGYCEANAIGAETVTLKIRYAGVNQTTRSKTMPTPLAAITDLEDCQPAGAVFPPRKGIRLLASHCPRWRGEPPELSRSCAWRLKPPESTGQKRRCDA